MSKKIKKYVLPYFPYLIAFWFFSKCGTAYRMAAGANLGEKLFGMVKTIGPVFQSYAPGLGLFDLAVGVAGAVILYFVVQSKIKKARKFRRDMEYGSARWGTEADIKPFVDPKFENNIILTGTEFLTMNTRPKNPANARNLNACVIGSSGSGKTRFWLTPQLLQAHSSYVVVDPKGGTLAQCGYFLQKKKGYKVKVFNSIDFSKSMHYNPMAYIKTESDVLKFVNALIANTKGDGKEGDEFWTKAETLLYCALVPFDIAELREIMSYDELELDKLGDEKTALFFLISDTDTTYNFIVALAFSQMFNLLCERADNKYGGRLPHHVRVLWDEAANTGQVPGLEKIVAVIRSREVSLTLFYQAMSQCKALYKDNAETIMGNMDSIVFLGGREASTLKDISENWLGKATISMQTDSRTRGQSESYGLNTQRLGRELLTTSEITTMPGNKCLLQLRGLPPFFSPKYDLKQHPNYRYTAEYDSKRNAFHLERLTSRRLRLKPEEEYTVYEVDTSDEDADILNYDDLDSADDFV